MSSSRHEDIKRDEHEHDMVMPGFRFHPTEEELIEFYLRRKVEGKRFNVELITFLDLYRYDPWELPALAAIGEKEWYFYVPRDKKYRNGDRPNRVTTSGYWKATGADRMIRSENSPNSSSSTTTSSNSIGLKKTLVFYTGKAPKGVRTTWIMNEYRLPHHDTQLYQKTEISLCRVYKRTGVDDNALSRGTNNRRVQQQTALVTAAAFGASHPLNETITDGSSSSTTSTSDHHHLSAIAAATTTDTTLPDYSIVVPTTSEDRIMQLHHHYHQNSTKQVSSFGNPNSSTSLYSTSSSNNLYAPTTITATDYDLHGLVNYQQQQQQQVYHNNPTQSRAHSQAPSLNMFPERLWDWNQIQEASRDHYNVNAPFFFK